MSGTALVIAELLLIGLVLGLAVYELISLRRDKRRRERDAKRPD